MLSRIAADVYAIERHEELSQLARSRLERLGYDNVKIRTGDGSDGWPEAAPFDAIIVAASGPAVPQVLKEQLEIGGHLIMPVDELGEQRLVKVTCTTANSFEEEDLGDVKFVPLIGTYGWQAGEIPPRPIIAEAASARQRALPELIHDAAEPLPAPDDASFAGFIDQFADGRVVLLGEATHGTSEFYRARCAITRRLIEKHGFCCVAVEADWPYAASVDRYVRQRPLPAHADVCRRIRGFWPRKLLKPSFEPKA